MSGMVSADENAELYEWYGYQTISPRKVRQALAGNPKGEQLVFEINSVGGEVFAGFEIFTLLQQSECRTVAEIQSLAASAASIIAVGAKEVRISPVGQLMIHPASTVTEGNAVAHERNRRMLESITESLLNAYEMRCGTHLTREELREMLNREEWICAQDAVKYGFADSILYIEDDMQTLPVMNAAVWNLPDFRTLRQQYIAIKNKSDLAGRKRMLAQIEMERMRYGG